jgi:4-hydroxy-2-oxoheptanedioate aldolase
MSAFLQETWDKGGVVVNGWLSIPSSVSAELMGQQPFDAMTIDLQHGLVDYQTALTMLQALKSSEAVPFVRVPWNEPGIIMKMLDAGAWGIICPMINNAQDADRLVRTCHYPPNGFRSWGPTRASLGMGGRYREESERNVVVMPMIETPDALQNLDEILAVDGVDACYVGPADVALALGSDPRLDHTDPRVVEAQNNIVEACRRHNVIPGIHCGTAAGAKIMIDAGFRFVSLGSDSRFLAMQAAAEIAGLKGAASDAPAGTPAY